MTIAWNAFTPWAALSGGALIGLAAALLVLLNGRIAGISGILGGLLQAKHDERGWRAAFLLGLIAAPPAYALFARLPPLQIEASNGVLLLAGLCVGLGTRFAGGCTSGHGVCGLARLSRRSLAATASFMVCGLLTVYVMRHVLVP